MIFSLLSTEWMKRLVNSKLLWIVGTTGKLTVFGTVKSRTKTTLSGHAGIQVSYKK